MNKDECLTEEWWNVISNIAYCVPCVAALDKNLLSTALAVVLVLLCSSLRHLPRHLLAKHYLYDIFRGADFTSVGILLIVLVCEQQQLNHQGVQLAIVLYAIVANAVFFSFGDLFPWEVIVFYYTVPLLYMLINYNDFLKQILRQHTGQLALLTSVSVMLRLTEQKTITPALGFHEGGTTCIPDHGMWHFASAALLTHILYQLPKEVAPVSKQQQV